MPRGAYCRIPLYLVNSTNELRTAVDPIEFATSLGPSANGIKIMLPVASGACQIMDVNAVLSARPGCLSK
jgi:hypothetical protein